MPSRDEILHAAELIRAGRLVAFPTETVYGLGANALDAGAVERIFRAKGRPATSPLIVHVASAAMARQVVRAWPEAADGLAARFWPGPLTLVLPKAPAIPSRVTAGLDTVGVRMPAHPVAQALIEAAGVPVAAPSANRFTQLSPTTAEHVRQGLGAAVDLILDGGPTEVGIESTVLSLAGGTPVLLRPGMIGKPDLEAVIGPIAVAEAAEGAHPSPGMHERHYSPRTPLVVSRKLPVSGNTVYLWHTVELPAKKTVKMPNEANRFAQRLYAVLHELDHEGWDWIVVEPVPDGPEWDGVRDRLRRASAATDGERRRAGDRVI